MCWRGGGGGRSKCVCVFFYFYERLTVPVVFFCFFFIMVSAQQFEQKAYRKWLGKYDSKILLSTSSFQTCQCDTWKVLPTLDLLQSKLAYTDFTPPLPEWLPPQTQELLLRQFCSPWRVQADFHLAWYKTPPSIMAHLSHTAASELRHTHQKNLCDVDWRTRSKKSQVTIWASCDIWRCFVHSVPLIVTHETQLKTKTDGVVRIPDFQFLF